MTRFTNSISKSITLRPTQVYRAHDLRIVDQTDRVIPAGTIVEITGWGSADNGMVLSAHLSMSSGGGHVHQSDLAPAPEIGKPPAPVDPYASYVAVKPPTATVPAQRSRGSATPGWIMVAALAAVAWFMTRK